MSAPHWIGRNDPDAFQQSYVEAAHAVADAARDYQWARLLDLLTHNPGRINAGRLGGTSGYAPLHQAAHGGAPAEVVQALLEIGALRTLRTTAGEQAVDIARQHGHEHLLDLLTPKPTLTFPAAKLTAVEAGVHQVIRDREGIQHLLDGTTLRFPPLELLTETPGNELWCPIPGMYGGFHLQLGQVADEPICIVDSWIRVVEGSEERRLVSAGGVLSLPFSNSL
ncbi:ankyrin repeat domain-containing protein [Deinococcus sp. 14RED07]|uniref:ankyrin repeat domain-containing protein n=1 Tax=unclassified Deinococcus TaxID=2623546 RepID=UPI001E3093B6|nr:MULTISPECIES: ankyrin repeat domain-containing protein [unclassified Deinococcus]MCD0164100.1 ankyrin repeat domain-containing protein [Deinococcus sp. 12RED42]MCD0174558.1 ankyrin repeat domain-containing protein [Deinococcus sp. 14RED07]